MMQTVLCVEDDVLCRQLLETILSTSGYRVFEARNASEGVSIVEREKPDVIVVDLGLPLVNGLELISRLKAEFPASTYYIALTADTGKYNRERAKTAGFDEYLTKPFSPRELVGAVQRSANMQA
jgi:CheY-like chemotaxis protein